MKIAHLADLHLGKRLREYSLIEDQKYILDEIIDILKQQKVTTVLIAGDVYDTGIPNAEAMSLLSGFLTQLSSLGMHVIMIAGNHDNVTRLSYGKEIFASANIHITGKYTGKLDVTTLEDEYGTINFYSLPYIRPIYVNQYLPEDNQIEGYTAAVQVAINTVQIPSDARNIILSHQFVTGTVVDDRGSEVTVGGTDNVDGNVYNAFDYVALGHIHRPQSVLRPTMRYAGTPLKYSIGEANTQKTMTIIDIKEKGNIDIQEIPLQPLHDVFIIRDTFENIINTTKQVSNDYVQFELLDETMVFNAMSDLRKLYLNILGISYPNIIHRQTSIEKQQHTTTVQTPDTLFQQFYTQYTGNQLTDTQTKILQDLIDEIWKEGETK